MNEAVIVSTARTPIGNAYRGAFNATAGVELAAPVLRAALERAEIEPGEVEELTFGRGYPEGATGGNVRATQLSGPACRPPRRPRWSAVSAPRALKPSHPPRGG